MKLIGGIIDALILIFVAASSGYVFMLAYALFNVQWKFLCLFRHKWRNGVVMRCRPERFEGEAAIAIMPPKNGALLARKCSRCGLHEVESRSVGWCLLHQTERFVELPERSR